MGKTYTDQFVRSFPPDDAGIIGKVFLTMDGSHGAFAQLALATNTPDPESSFGTIALSTPPLPDEQLW